MKEEYSVPISIVEKNGMGIDERVRYIIEGVRMSQKLTRDNMFILDFKEQKLLWESKNLLFMGNKQKRRKSQNPYWSMTSDETFRKLTVISRELCTAVGKYFTKGEDGLVCTIDYPIIAGNREIYVTQKSTITILADPSAKEKHTMGVRIIGINTVQTSTSDIMECTLILPNGDIRLYDMEEEHFMPPRQRVILTDREREVLLRAKSGLKRDELAEKMNISLNTLKKHKQSIYKKLDAHTFQQAIVYATKYNQI